MERSNKTLPKFRHPKIYDLFLGPNRPPLSLALGPDDLLLSRHPSLALGRLLHRQWIAHFHQIEIRKVGGHLHFAREGEKKINKTRFFLRFAIV